MFWQDYFSFFQCCTHIHHKIECYLYNYYKIYMYHTKEVIKVTWFTRRLHHRHNYSSWALELSDKFPRVEAVAPGTWTLPNIICIYFKLVGPHFLNYARTYLHFLSFYNGIYNKLATTNESIIYIHVLWHLHLGALATMHHHNPRLLCFIHLWQHFFNYMKQV
jgi:hypothetical protein